MTKLPERLQSETGFSLKRRTPCPLSIAIANARHASATGSTALAVAMGAYLLMHGVNAEAQEGAQNNEIMDVMVITARTKEETVLDAPLSVSAFSGDQLEERGVENMYDLAAMTPGMQFQQAGSTSSSRPIFRGLSQLARTSGDSANVGIFVDGIYSSGLSGVDLSFIGLERVEVVRGPQSAAYGRNTFSGAINYITRRPTDELEYGFTATLGEYGMSGTSGYLSGPVINNVLALRLDAAKTDTGGYFENQARTGQRLNARATEMFRVGANFTPMDRLNVFASVGYTRDETTQPPLIAVHRTDPRRVAKPAPTARAPVQVGRRLGGRIDDYSDTYSFDPLAGGERESIRTALIADYEIGDYIISSRTGYEDRKIYNIVDMSETPGGTQIPGAPPPAPATFATIASGAQEDRWEFSQDLRLQPATSGRFNWTLGLYYSYERNRNSDVRFSDRNLGTPPNLIAPAPVGGRGLPNLVNVDTSIFRSVYASADYALLDNLVFTAEGRYTWERKNELPLEANYGTTAGMLNPEMSTEFNYFTPRFILQYSPLDNLNLYASAAKGTKSGGSNAVAPLESERTFDPESNWTYELGLKTRLLDNTLHLSAAVYHIRWTDQQMLVFATAPGSQSPITITGNLAKTEVNGFEASAQWYPLNWLALDATYNYNDARYKDAQTDSYVDFVDCADLPRLECVNGVTTGRIDGNRVEYTPEHQATLGASLNIPAFGEWRYIGRADVSTNSRIWVDGGNIGYIQGSSQARLSLGLQSDTFTVRGFCNNLTNDKTPITGFVSRDFYGQPHYYVRAREGRMCGVTVSADF